MKAINMGYMTSMQNSLALNKCIHNNGVHIIREQQPIKCGLFGTYGKVIRKCVNCELHIPKGDCDE